jgi:hypothetical protein
MINYEEIIENLQPELVIKLMEQLGADRYEDKGKYIVFPTICHNITSSEASSKLYFYKDTKLFYCYTECGPMNIFKFLKNYYETREIEYDWFVDIYEVILNCSTTNLIGLTKKREKLSDKYKRKEPKKLETYSTGILDVFVKSYPVEWLNDGISREAMDRFKILYSISQNKIIIPHFNEKGELVGIRGRTLNEEEAQTFGKYMPVQIENKWYSHPLSLNLYGLDINKDNIKKNGVCYLFEAEKSCLQMDSFSMPNCSAAICGSNFNKFQLKLLLKTASPKEIVICFDKEELPKEDKYFYKLLKLCRKYSKYCNFSFIYDRENLLDLKDSPTDKGEEIFKKLLEKRVVVK